MFEIIISLLAVWLLIKAICLAAKLTWGTAKVIATVLLSLAIPLFILCLVFVGGAFLLLPMVMLAGAWGLMKACG